MTGQSLAVTRSNVKYLFDKLDNGRRVTYLGRHEKESPMVATRWDKRFYASTRGQVVSLLRRGRRTVDELAGALGLTDNAVRAHLASLERDGLVKQEGVRRGAGKPAYAYALTPDAERLFPKAYGPVLRQILDVLVERVPADQLEDALREAGRRIAAGHPARNGDRRARIAQAAALLEDLGGLVEVEEGEDSTTIRGYDCPLAAAVPSHPEVCRLAEAMLEAVVGAPVTECCERGASPHCRFVVPTSADSLI
jgi:predicted ArsR family transcriptional regulator